jgi:hypothetical protein
MTTKEVRVTFRGIDKTREAFSRVLREDVFENLTVVQLILAVVFIEHINYNYLLKI